MERIEHCPKTIVTLQLLVKLWMKTVKSKWNMRKQKLHERLERKEYILLLSYYLSIRKNTTSKWRVNARIHVHIRHICYCFKQDAKDSLKLTWKILQSRYERKELQTKLKGKENLNRT